MTKRVQHMVWLVAGLVLVATGYALYQRTAEQALFGWLTGPFILALWVLILSIRGHKYEIKYLIISSLSGFLFFLGFPNMPFTVLLFGAFIPLLWLEKEAATRHTEGGHLKYLGFYLYNGFVLWNVSTTWWVGNAGLLPGMIANFLNAFFMWIPFWAFHKQGLWLAKQPVLARRPPLFFMLKYACFVANWIGFEYLHLNWDLSWSWLTLGNAFAQQIDWIQWYEYTGVFGGSLWILLGNVLVFNVLNKKINQQKLTPQYLSVVALWWLLPLSISFFLGKNSAYQTAPYTAEVVAIQPNYEPHYEKFSIPESTQWLRFETLTTRAADSTTDYVLFPETSFDLRDQAQFANHPIFNDMTALMARYPNMHLVAGIDAFKIYAQQVARPPMALPETVRVHEYADGSKTFWESYNGALQLNAQTQNRPFYKKSKLVPGPEILPFGSVLAWLKPLFKKFGGTLGGLGTQDTRPAFWNKDGQRAVAPVICYESIYGDFCTGFVRSGAQAFFVLTNDGWWDDTPGYVQHLKFAQLRAVECRRAVVRAANTGSSAFIDAYGHIQQKTDYGVEASPKQEILLHKNITFYAQYGDYLGILGSILSVLGLVFYLILSFFKPKKS